MASGRGRRVLHRGEFDSDATEYLWQLKALLEVSKKLARLVDVADLARQAVVQAHQLVGTDVACLAVREKPGLLVMRGVSGGRTEELQRLHIPAGAGIGGKVLLVHEPVVVTDYAHDPNITRDFVDVVAYAEGIGGMAGVPVRYGGEILGVLYTAIRSSGSIEGRLLSRQSEFARNLAPHLARALEVSRLRRETAEAERYRVATQLHDELGQTLFQIGLSTKRTKELARRVAPDLLHQLEEIEARASLASSYLRECLRALSPTTPQNALVALINVDVENFSERSGIPAQLIELGEPMPVSSTVAGALLAVLREGLLNVERHAQASNVVVTLHFEESQLGIIIQDDGRGLEPGFVIPMFPQGTSGWGLATLQQRVEALGGQICLMPNEDGGATLMASIPVERVKPA